MGPGQTVTLSPIGRELEDLSNEGAHRRMHLHPLEEARGELIGFIAWSLSCPRRFSGKWWGFPAKKAEHERYAAN